MYVPLAVGVRHPEHHRDRVHDQAEAPLALAERRLRLLELNRDASHPRLIEAQEEERTRLARELHDDITQRLTLVSICLERVKHGSTAPPVSGGNRSRQPANGHLIQDPHALSHRLHSSKLDLLGLRRAATGLCAELSEAHGVTIDFHAENIAERLPQELSLCLFRVLQEALQNAIKHSGSRQVQVSLRCGARKSNSPLSMRVPASTTGR